MNHFLLFLALWFGPGLLFASYHIFKIPGSLQEKLVLSLILSMFGPLGGLFSRFMYLATQK